MSEASTAPTPFLSGVIEGFYGRPWSLEQRSVLFQRMASWQLNTYLYGPKDDLHHRASWRRLYSEADLADLRESVDQCQTSGIRFVYALGPGLDIGYSSEDELETLRQRFKQLREIGVVDFALLFDDIPDVMSAADRSRFGSFAAAQAWITNTLYEELARESPEAVFLVCPTPYCSRMDEEGLGGKDYLEELGARLHPSIYLFWTGPSIISEEISEDHLACLKQRIKRRPLIWDNYHANDYDLRRLYTGPIDGRPGTATEHLSGIMMNPNCEFESNFVPVYSLGRYVNLGDAYSPIQAFSDGIVLWKEEFETVGEAWSVDEIRLFASIYYLPFSMGAAARAMMDDVKAVIQRNPRDWGDAEDRFQKWRGMIQSISVKMTELKNRELFYTFNRQWWEIREEFELIARFVEHKKTQGGSAVLPTSPEHLKGTYRGGTIHQLQSLLSMGEDGQFSEA